MDDSRNLYAACYENSKIIRFGDSDTVGTVLTTGLNNTKHFVEPTYIFVDENRSIYISDWGNNRVIKQVKDMQYNSIVAGSLKYPQGLFVDHMNNLYVVDGGNNRVMHWCKGCETGETVVGGNGEGNQANQFDDAKDLAFDRKYNLYVVDRDNHRVQRFDVYIS
ncbi:unnamed protein product [Adineta ricciae]|uniref:Uncharacterized protein n=1 Tax=Adineta ricciae TaxID=249248 RepID=A0A815KG14_ADIRI|nr:unnamed protein product [Adineta ricciae]CAF1392817.1 unnamed protein product [Adineta ricciae]